MTERAPDQLAADFIVDVIGQLETLKRDAGEAALDSDAVEGLRISITSLSNNLKRALAYLGFETAQETYTHSEQRTRTVARRTVATPQTTGPTHPYTAVVTQPYESECLSCHTRMAVRATPVPGRAGPLIQYYCPRCEVAP